MKSCPKCGRSYEGGEAFCPNDGSRLVRASQMAQVEPADPLIGQRLAGRYRVIRALGEGGMGVVYEAEHEVIDRRVAIKVLREDVSKNENIVARFHQEAKSASRIGHENIIDILDFGETPNGQSFLVMEMLVGQDLAHVLADHGLLPLERGIPILLQCCKALGAAHAKGIVHRDMKPENIFLVHRDDHPDFVKIVDFGIAKMSDQETPGAPGRKLTKTGMIFGTPEYMSSEQAAGKPTDHRVDIYAMGIIMYEMLTGRVPFVGQSFMEILTKHLLEDPPPMAIINPQVHVPPALEQVVMKALSKNPDARQQTMADLADEIIEAIEASDLRESMRSLKSDRPPPLSVRPPLATPPTGLRGTGSSTVRLQAPTPPRVPALSAQDSGVGPAMPAPTIDAPPRRGSGLLLAGGGLLALVGAALIGWVALRGQGLTGRAETDAGTAARPPAEDAGLVVPSGMDAGQTVVAGADAGETTAEDAGAAVEGPLVWVGVTSSPSRATVHVEGRGQVCDATPCRFQTPAGQSVTMRLVRGRLEGIHAVVPSTDTPPIHVTLRPARPDRPDEPRPRDAGTRRPRDSGSLRGLKLMDANVFRFH